MTRTFKALDYGKSMYGGWYCNFIENGIMNGLHGNTYKELLRRCKLCGITLKDAKRIDY